MNVQNLRSGMIVKNYKELCGILDVPVKSGKSKRLQINDMERYFSFHKIKNSYVIDEVFNVPNMKVDKRKDPAKTSNNNMYSKDIQALIIDILAQAKGNAVYLSTNAFLRKLDMINDNYATGRMFIPRLSELTNVPQEYCYDFYNNTNIKLRDKLETALKGLRSRALVIWNHSVTVCVRVAENIEKNEVEELVLNDNKIVTIKVNTIHRKATETEKELILKAEKRVLLSMKYNSLQEAFLGGKWREYKDRVNKILLDQANIEYYYTSYEVVYNHENIVQEKLTKLKLNERKSIQNNLNSNVNSMINKNAKTIKSRVSKKVMLTKSDAIYMNEDYLNHTKTLVDTVIAKSAKNITVELKQDAQLRVEQITFNSELPF